MSVITSKNIPFYLQNANAFYLKQNGDEFVHVFTNKAFGMPSEASDVRLYLNLQAENTVEFAKVLMVLKSKLCGKFSKLTLFGLKKLFSVLFVSSNPSALRLSSIISRHVSTQKSQMYKQNQK